MYSLQLDLNAKPFTLPAWHIPPASGDKIHTELKHMKDCGITGEVEGPAAWPLPMVIVYKKNGNTGLCTDFRETRQMR